MPLEEKLPGSVHQLDTHHIEAQYHARYREQLPMLAAMAERVEDVHFGDEGVPEGLSTLLQQKIGEMEVQ